MARKSQETTNLTEKEVEMIQRIADVIGESRSSVIRSAVRLYIRERAPRLLGLEESELTPFQDS
jgi:metal-responsive CopG/Arc/MetJ family transcriptional regulator